MINHDDFMGKPLQDLVDYLTAERMDYAINFYCVLYNGRYTRLTKLVTITDCMVKEIVHISNLLPDYSYDIQIR